MVTSKKSTQQQAPDAAPEVKAVDVYKNVSGVKLHTSMGVIWPGSEVMLQAKEAKAFGAKLMPRT